jgi:hypothetical protein
MTPQSITILTKPMIIVSVIHDARNFASSPWAFLSKGCLANFGNIAHHKCFYNRTRSAIFFVQGIPLSSFRSGLMKIVATISVILTQLLTFGIIHMHGVRIAIMRFTHIGLIVYVHISAGLISRQWGSRTFLMMFTKETSRNGRTHTLCLRVFIITLATCFRLLGFLFCICSHPYFSGRKNTG